jgi:hypothetical protein
MSTAWTDDRTPIREALYEKAHKYGDKLDKPLVVALGSMIHAGSDPGWVRSGESFTGVVSGFRE